jgi:glycosyltransferase involved in cell wall biosynthesis
MKRISVAMATFDGERFLAEQLESLARQTVTPHELVVRDDGSRDGTLSLLAAFEADSPFPVRIEPGEKRLGFADSFLAAAASCTGDLIAFCDQDDLWLPRKLERCRAAFDAEEVLVVLHTSTIVDERLVPTGQRYPDVGEDRVVAPLASDPWLAVRGMSMAVDSRVVRLADPARRPPSHYLAGAPMHHDEWVYAIGSSLGAVSLIAEPLALYRQHGANVAGAPAGLTARLRETVTTGWTYYARRHDQARALERLFGDLDASPGDEAIKRRAAAAARFHGELARGLERRLAVYEPGASRARRVGALARLARDGAYGGFGFGALARDAVMVALGRHG